MTTLGDIRSKPGDPWAALGGEQQHFGALPADSTSPIAANSRGSERISETARLQAASVSSCVSCEKLGFSWDQTSDYVNIYLPLAGATAEDVASSFASRCCAIQAQLHGRRHTFAISELFSTIEPLRSSVRVPKHGRHVTVRLAKLEPGLEWPTLRPLSQIVL